jgi:hypothetical protein
MKGQKLHRYFKHIGVRSFIPTGAPFNTRLRTPEPAVPGGQDGLFG